MTGGQSMITLKQYYMNRDIEFKNELTEQLRKNAEETVRRVNEFLSASGLPVEISPRSKTPVPSGWRPELINRTTTNAAPRSNHVTCRACDLYDPDGVLDDWAMNNLDVLAKIGLWLEHPAATKGWIHLQTVAPRSGNRVFYP